MPELLLLIVCCALLGAAVVSTSAAARYRTRFRSLCWACSRSHVAVFGHRDMVPLWAHVLTGAVLLAVGFVLFLMGVLGAGDGKLMAAAGLWVGPAGMGSFLVGVGLLGLGLGLLSLLPFEATRRLRNDLPFAAAISPPAIALLALRAFPVAGNA